MGVPPCDRPGTLAAVSSRLALFLAVGLLAVAAAGTVVGVTLATRQDPVQPEVLEGKPPVGDDLTTPAANEIRAAFESWPDGSIDTMQRLGREYPNDPQVQLYRGIALIWAGYPGESGPVLRTAKRAGRDTIWEIRADDLLHPQYFTGYPLYEPVGPDPLLRRGSQLQAQGHQHSAARVFQQAATRSPNDPEALVAAAVARFDKEDPSASFSRLGPLTRRFPESQAVRFYLGLMLAWVGEGDEAVEQFRAAVELGPGTERGRAAASFLERVGAPDAETGAGSGDSTE